MGVQFATYRDLEVSLSERSETLARASRQSWETKDTFLSHSSKDAAYLPGVIRLLQRHGASVYCDLDDTRLPSNPSPETASHIRQQLAVSKRLVLFVTRNSRESKWVPWELGIGDATLTAGKVALLPAAAEPQDQDWARQEYLGIYRHIVHGLIRGESEPQWMVYDHRSNEATLLREWCRGS